MDQRWMDRNTRQSDEDSESEYDVVDNLEVRNLWVPARPLDQDNEYADRDVPRSRPAPGLSGVSTRMNNIPCRKKQLSSGPVVNRDLKPGRARSNLIHVASAEMRSIPVQPENWPSRRLSPSPVRDLHALNLHQPCRNDKRASERDKFSQHTPDVLGPWSGERFQDPSETLRLCLDLETGDRQRRPPDTAGRHLQLEWPQSKEEGRSFGPLEEPQQPFYKEEWYVGGCSRVDAEHALHLANTDGAFLVRNSSTNTSGEPLVLAIYSEKKVYNIKIRFIGESNKYALGTGLRSNDMFDSVADMIRFHSIFPIVLVSGRTLPGSRHSESCVLTCPLTRRDVDLLLQ